MNFYVTSVVLDNKDINYLLNTSNLNTHHEDPGHHITNINKPNLLSWVAKKFNDVIKFGKVDPRMKFYKLCAGAGEVPQHIDQDFKFENKYAIYSLLIYLNDKYTGGQTMFGNCKAPSVSVGAGLCFPHKLLHSGKRILTGTKYVLKTDILI